MEAMEPSLLGSPRVNKRSCLGTPAQGRVAARYRANVRMFIANVRLSMISRVDAEESAVLSRPGSTHAPRWSKAAATAFASVANAGVSRTLGRRGAASVGSGSGSLELGRLARERSAPADFSCANSRSKRSSFEPTMKP